MRKLVLASCCLLAVLLVGCFYVGTAAAEDWTSSNGYQYPSTPTASSVSYAPNANIEDRMSEIEASFAKWQADQAAAKKKAAGRPSVEAGGRIMWDWADFNQNTESYAQVGDQLNGSEFRRARIFIKGHAFDVVDYKAEYDFADTATVAGSTIQSTAFKDVYVQINELPLLGHVRVGHFKEPIGLEQLTSSKYITFMERSLADEHGFVPGRNSGVMAHNTYANENGTWAIGAFYTDMTSEPPRIQTDDGGMALSMRGTFLPWYDEATEGRGLWHLGISYSYRDTPFDTARFRQRPECHLADYVVDTGTIADVPSWQLLGMETAVVYGPLSVQAEWLCAFVHRTAADDLYYNGGYIYVSYFLTGENRRYKRTAGCFERIKPYENFFRVRGEDGCVYTGKGAWELAYRCSYIDLAQFATGNRLSGRVWDHTIGVNWYLNPYTRLMFNYVNSTADNLAANGGNMSIFEMRTQIDF